MAVLNGFRRARAAEFRHGERKGCLKNTRDAVLTTIELWARDFDQSSVYWLNGLAGTGKSTIAKTIAERLFVDDQLGASFFCSRDFEDRRNLHFIFPTLATQLARKFLEFQDPRPIDRVGSRHRVRIAVQPDGEVDRPTPQQN